MTDADSRTFPVKLQSGSGLSVELNANGSLRRIDRGDVVLNLFLGNEVEGGPANLYLRSLGAPHEWTPLLGPSSPAEMAVGEAGLVARGEWNGIRFTLSLVLAESAAAWFWHVEIANTGADARTVDLIYAQDLALAPYGAVRMNEHYVSQYIDYAPFRHAERGAVLAVRQNLSMGGRHPWALIGSLGRAASFATDALQLHGLATRSGDAPSALSGALPGSRLQHEHSMAVIQESAIRLEPGAAVRSGFFGWFEEDHAEASSAADLVFVGKALALPEAVPPASPSDGRGAPPASTLFSSCPRLQTRDLTDAEIDDLFGGERHEVERDGETMLSFFAGERRHVILRAKELRVLRPHGHIMRTGDALTPDEASLTSTAWMAGVFHSMVTQGHVSINRFLSTVRSYLGLLRSSGQRIFVELEDGYRVLGVPSAFEMTPGSCRWVYKHAGGIVEVRSRAATDRHELVLSVEVLAGAERRFLISNHVALDGDDGSIAIPVPFTRDADGIVVRTLPDTDVGRRFPDGAFRIDPDPGTPIERVGGDELLFADGESRRQPFLVIVTAPAAAVSFRITGRLIAPDGAPRSAVTRAADESSEADHWRALVGPVSFHSSKGGDADLSRFCRILPWLAHDAMIHYLAPRGLEQFSGGGWGTRDVSQGPVELLLALGKREPVRDLLLRLFKNQNPDGDWPQWFMFFERERSIRPDDSHGDIVFWPVLALAEYVLASDDGSIFDEVVPFFHPDGDDRAEKATVRVHVDRALGVMRMRVIPDTHLAAYGHGDWNDSLQPVDPSMRERLCSSWTVTLHFQTVTALAKALGRVGRPEGVPELEESAARIRADFQRLLIADDTLAGFAYFNPDGRIDYLLHPSDRRTGIHYRLLPMIHAVINGLFTPEQAKTHVGYMREHLLGPDGAHLFDRPPEYRGGPQQLFQRAESSTYFGREIGIMYTHAHLRYAEAMARYGDADAFFLALRQANPIGIRDVVRQAAPRQANCYYSSSDAAVADRYEGLDRYRDIMAGRVPFEGGWRVYSSGAGISLRLIREHFLGLRLGESEIAFDPVVPRALDGLSADVELAGKPVRVVYRVRRAGCGPSAITLNGGALPFDREANPYRPGAAVVPMAALRERLNADRNELVVELG